MAFSAEPAFAENPEHARWSDGQGAIICLQNAALEVARLRQALKEAGQPYGMNSDYVEAEKAFWTLRRSRVLFFDTDAMLLRECEQAASGAHHSLDRLIWTPAPAGLPEPPKHIMHGSAVRAPEACMLPMAQVVAPAELPGVAGMAPAVASRRRRGRWRRPFVVG